MSTDHLVAAVDLGGTKALAGVVGRDGLVHSRVWLASRDLKDRPAALLDRIAEAAVSAAERANVPFDQVAAVGVGVPGPLDRSRSIVSVAPNLGWEELPVRAELERRLPGTRAYLENDVRAAALAEHTFGAGRGYRSMLAVFVGTGVGGGLIVDGRLYHGTRGGAGEIGHVVACVGGPRCGCGRRGCLEALAARAAVARYVIQQVARGRHTVLSSLLGGDLTALTSRDLSAAIKQGDPVAVRAAHRSARYVGVALGGIVNLLDPEAIVLGGGIVEALGARYVGWAAAAARPHILADSARGLPIVASELGDDAGLLGAALTAFEGLASRNATPA
jgi:glucokinase